MGGVVGIYSRLQYLSLNISEEYGYYQDMQKKIQTNEFKVDTGIQKIGGKAGRWLTNTNFNNLLSFFAFFRFGTPLRKEERKKDVFSEVNNLFLHIIIHQKAQKNSFDVRLGKSLLFFGGNL